MVTAKALFKYLLLAFAIALLLGYLLRPFVHPERRKLLPRYALISLPPHTILPLNIGTRLSQELRPIWLKLCD